jgi:hypothetical protein
MASISMDYIVQFGSRSRLQIERTARERRSAESNNFMTSFFERTWFVWWVFAVIVIVRRSHLLVSDFGLSDLDTSPHHEGESVRNAGGLAAF